jgi:hypothetical protein
MGQRRSDVVGESLIRRRDVFQRGTQVSPGTAPGRPYFCDHMAASRDRDSLSPLDRIKKVREIARRLGRGHRSHASMLSDNQIDTRAILKFPLI